MMCWKGFWRDMIASDEESRPCAFLKQVTLPWAMQHDRVDFVQRDAEAFRMARVLVVCLLVHDV